MDMSRSWNVQGDVEQDCRAGLFWQDCLFLRGEFSREKLELNRIC